jgi:hypothetical protein
MRAAVGPPRPLNRELLPVCKISSGRISRLVGRVKLNNVGTSQ